MDHDTAYAAMAKYKAQCQNDAGAVWADGEGGPEVGRRGGVVRLRSGSKVPVYIRVGDIVWKSRRIPHQTRPSWYLFVSHFA